MYRARKNGKNGFGLTEICWSIFSGFSASEADLQHPNIEEETKEPSEAPVAPGPSNLIAPGDEVMPETLCSSAPAQLHDCARAFSSFDMNNCIPSPVKTASYGKGGPASTSVAASSSPLTSATPTCADVFASMNLSPKTSDSEDHFDSLSLLEESVEDALVLSNRFDKRGRNAWVLVYVPAAGAGVRGIVTSASLTAPVAAVENQVEIEEIFNPNFGRPGALPISEIWLVGKNFAPCDDASILVYYKVLMQSIADRAAELQLAQQQMDEILGVGWHLNAPLVAFGASNPMGVQQLLDLFLTCHEMAAAVVALLTSRKIPLSWDGTPVLTGDIQTDLEAFQRPGKDLAAAAVLLTQLVGTWTWALGEGIMCPADTTRYLEANWWHLHISMNSGIAAGQGVAERVVHVPYMGWYCGKDLDSSLVAAVFPVHTNVQDNGLGDEVEVVVRNYLLQRELEAFEQAAAYAAGLQHAQQAAAANMQPPAWNAQNAEAELHVPVAGMDAWGAVPAEAAFVGAAGGAAV